MTSERDPGQWWTETLSPLSGCTSAGAGCDNCHSIRRMKRRLPMLRGAGNADVSPHTVLLHPERLAKLRTWLKPRRVLTPMLGDYFHHDVPDEFLDLAFGAMLASPQHTYCVLTKRPRRAADYLAACLTRNRKLCSAATEVNNTIISGAVVDIVLEGKERWPIFLMPSVWDQASADSACAAFSRLPAGVAWGLHVEPMLGPVDMRKAQPQARATLPAWIVVGAEQGPGARPFDLDWARSLRDQCASASVPFWFKGGSRRSDPPPDLNVRQAPWGAA